MFQIHKIEDPADVAGLKRDYVAAAVAPLDGMWLCGFAAMAAHYTITQSGRVVGYFCVNDEAHVLQFYLAPQHRHASASVLASVLNGEDSPAGPVKGAFVSTAEPLFFSLCLDHFDTFTVNALMYQSANDEVAGAESETADLRLVTSDQLATALAFVHESIGAPLEWLEGYLGNLVGRQELFGLWRDGTLIATGECRGYDTYQESYADLGVIVGVAARKQGVATRVLQRLKGVASERELIPICSTEQGNVGARKAIERAGFYPWHRIVEFRQTGNASALTGA